MAGLIAETARVDPRARLAKDAVVGPGCVIGPEVEIGRGTRLFGVPHHDADVVASSLADAPLAGMFCAGELGPVGGKNFLHGFTASVVLLTRSN